MSERQVLVLGSIDHPKGVTCRPWSDIPSDVNVADFDAVILNLVPLLRRQFHDGDSFTQPQLNALPTADAFARLLFSGGREVIVIGIPGGRGLAPGGGHHVPWWLPHFPDIVLEQGKRYTVVDDNFEFYFQFVDEWSFHASERSHRCGEETRFCSGLHPPSKSSSCVVRPIARLDAGHFVSFSLQFAITDTGNKSSGLVYWLPPTTKLNHVEAVNLILARRYGIANKQDAPAWINKYKLPNQLPIEGQIRAIEEQIETLQNSLMESQARLVNATRYGALLYEQGEPLELLVCDAFSDLGAEVKGPRKSREDGRLADSKSRQAMLETKGLLGSIKAANIRELQTWITDAQIDEGWDGKGIYVANPFRTTDPALRTNVESYPDDCIKAAKKLHHCILPTPVLFEALRIHQRGELDLDRFWDTVFETDGLCELPLPEPDSPAEEEPSES